MPVEPFTGPVPEVQVPVAIVGAGACGLVAALTLADAGREALVLERDATPGGSTALSSGMIPACGTRAQRAAGVDDSPARMASDIRAKAGGEVDEAVLAAVCAASGETVDWLADAHGVDLELVQGFLYPGHSCERMHAPASRTGAELIGALARAAERAGITVVTAARVRTLLAEPGGAVRAVHIERPDGDIETLGCDALILACNGFGGSPELVRRHIPAMGDAIYFGHAGNDGDALRWGAGVGAEARHLGAFQGHGSVAEPHGILITWALMTEGGIEVNAAGERFSNEHEGYSEQGARVIAQPGSIAWCVYDERLHRLGLGFDDYARAVDAGAVRTAADAAELVAVTGAPRLADTLREIAACAAGTRADPFGRDFTGKPPLAPPYRAVRVTGALFHTQGGLAVDAGGRVLRPDGSALPNLLAGGGAACGLSGSSDRGYLSGNGLLTATVLGRLSALSALAL